VFDTVRSTSESALLFRANAGFSPSRGIGAIRMPASGAGLRPAGGRFAFVSGRPYRWNHSQLQSNVSNILASWFLEPLGGVSVEDGAAPGELEFAAAWPNPSGASVALRFALPRAAHARLVVFDLAGRRARTLWDGPLEAGAHDMAWDGRDERGAGVPAGLYWARLEAGGRSLTRRLVRVR